MQKITKHRINCHSKIYIILEITIQVKFLKKITKTTAIFDVNKVI